jgi:hypothetical protein
MFCNSSMKPSQLPQLECLMFVPGYDRYLRGNNAQVNIMQSQQFVRYMYLPLSGN